MAASALLLAITPGGALAFDKAAANAGLQVIASATTTPELKIKIAAYRVARQKYEEQAAAYWEQVTEKRRVRSAKRRNNQAIVLDDYVLAQPPVYSGPPKPFDPSEPLEEAAPQPKRYIPLEADFLQSAAKEYDFVPTRPRSEMEFKGAYVGAAAAAGLTKEQVVRIYGFEVGGNGSYDTQAGLEYRKQARPISTALGYNQLLVANTIGLLAEQGEQIVAALRAKAAGSSRDAKMQMERKIDVLRRMIAFIRTVPNAWSEHEKLARTSKGHGIHAMNLDVDVGPLLQVQKLLDSVNFARMKGHKTPLTAAELEMMNLTGDGNGIDLVTMPVVMRQQVPTANYFQRRGYERNPIAIRHNTVAKLLAATDAKMDREVQLPGAKALATLFWDALAGYRQRRWCRSRAISSASCSTSYFKLIRNSNFLDPRLISTVI